ncbi:replication initiation protein, RepL2 [Kitasatospora sp. NPDC049285]|uniref:replication initiation protein, RepL2 n=1 Tax=Kitasatospora sp. NPDC049285 TaxID=3157096 RepID=UPI0034491625
MSDNELRGLLRRSNAMGPNQRLLLAFYSALPPGEDGTQRTAQKLAEEMGWAPTFFSRIRKELVEAGLLEEYSKFNNIPYYRLSSRALGRKGKVVQLRPVG